MSIDSERTDLCQMTGTQTMFDSCEGLHCGFRANLRGKEHSGCEEFINANVFLFLFFFLLFM